MARKSNKGINRRDLIAQGGVAGVGVAAVLADGGADAQAANVPAQWSHQADVVVIGSGAAGLPAAIRARDLGASVLIIEEAADIGGHAIISGGGVNIGGGHAHQQRYNIRDTPDDIYMEYTRPDHPLTRYNDRAIVRAFADKNVETYDFLIANGVKFNDAIPRNSLGDGSTIPRRISTLPSSSDYKDTINGSNGSGLMRALERSARAKGVNILLQHRMVRIVREQTNAGRVVGIVATDLQSNRSVNIRARRAVIACTGGSNSNLTVRTIYDSRLTEEYQVGCEPYTRQSGDAEQQGMAIGASLGSTNAQRNEMYLALQKTLYIGCRYGYDRWDPRSPVFEKAGASGIVVRDYQNAILVNTNGERFYDEMVGLGRSAGSDGGWAPVYHYFAAALGSAVRTIDGKKHRVGGPVWAIFDADAVVRERWTVEHPFVDTANGYFFTASNLKELANNLNRNTYMKHKMDAAVLEAQVTRYNGFVDAGGDADFGKPTPKYKIQKPPFYAAWATPILHDTYTGLRVDGRWNVIDVFGKPIPGFFCAGESAGGFSQHNLGRCVVGGYVAGTHSVRA
jgi:urocanate reductase